jgi:hypothetical protein
LFEIFTACFFKTKNIQSEGKKGRKKKKEFRKTERVNLHKTKKIKLFAFSLDWST